MLILSNNQLEHVDSGREMHFPLDDTSDTETCNENQHNAGVTTNHKPKRHSGDHGKSNHEDHNDAGKGEYKGSHSTESMPSVGAPTKPTSKVGNIITNYPQHGSVQTTFPSRLNTTDRENHNNTTPVACMWRKCSEAINTLRTTDSHVLAHTQADRSAVILI